MIKAILIPVLVGTCALYARAGERLAVSASRLVESTQNFESYSVGDENIHHDPEPGKGGYYWLAPADKTIASTRISLNDETFEKYLDVDSSELPSEGVTRLFIPHATPFGAITNAYTSVAGAGGYEGFYSSFRTRFPLYDFGDRPQVDDQDRMVLWAGRAGGGDTNGLLYVTAGCFSNAFHAVTLRDFVITTTNISESAWHDITLRVIPDVVRGSRALGFAIWIDGRPVVAAAEGYQILGDGCDSRELTDEARVLAAERRLFLSLTAPGVNESMSLGGVAFTGIGSVGNFCYSTNAPSAWAKPARVFTLCWDAGVTSICYRVGAEAEVSVAAGAIGTRNTVFAIPSEETDIEVTALYNEAGDYRQGFWTASGACTVVTNIVDSTTNFAFRCDGSGKVGTGYVRSFRREIGLGGGIGAYASFTDAKNQAIAQGVTIVLNEDFAANYNSEYDRHDVRIERNESVIIDLNGHSITNASGEHPTIMNYGKLTIIDSQGGGKVVPYAAYTGDTNDYRQTAVQNFASTKSTPELTIKGGIYDGWINACGNLSDVGGGRMTGVFSIVRSENAASEPQFISLGGDEFDYADNLVDKMLYYAYDEPYWKPLTNAFVWCGKGDDDKWSNTNNWRCGRVPAAGDYAIFPAAGTNAWEADMETGIAVRDIWFAGDVILHGTADFGNVKWTTPAEGKIRGDATLCWNGKLPPDLSSLLDARWSGTVAISEVGDKSPKLLSDMASWGTGSSKVRFAGVRGYYHRTDNLTLAYTLELADGANGYGWKNDAGFTGGVIVFPSLTGPGSFVSPKNTIANRQIIIFRDVMSYRGTLDVQGKRVVLGPGDVETLEAGSITWSTGLKIRSGYVHSCRVAAFGGTMDVAGNYDDELAIYSESTVGDSAMVVNLMPGSITAELCVTNPVGVVKVVRWSEDAVIIDGKRVVTNILTAVNSLTSVKVPTAKASLKGITFAKYYTPDVTAGIVMSSVRLSLNENAIPVYGSNGESASITFTDDGLVSVIVSDVIEGFWYGLGYTEELTGKWSKPTVWTLAEPGKTAAELVAPVMPGSSGFYRVEVSDVDPQEETK